MSRLDFSKKIVSVLIIFAISFVPALGFLPKSLNSQVEASIYLESMYVNVKVEAYASRSTKSKRVMTIPEGAPVDRLAQEASWSNIRYNGKTGWVASRTLVGITKIEVLDTKQNVTMYASRSTKGKVVTKIPANKQVSRLEVNQSWSNVKYGSKNGWVPTSQLNLRYTKETFAPRQYKLKENAPLQSTYTSSGKKISSIPKNTIVKSAEKYNQWFKITHNNKTGWVQAKYLQTYKSPLKVAQNIYGSNYTITSHNGDLMITDDILHTVALFDEGLVIEYGTRNEYDKAAKLITTLHGGSASELSDYMWSALWGYSYTYGKYHISPSSSSYETVVVIW